MRSLPTSLLFSLVVFVSPSLGAVAEEAIPLHQAQASGKVSVKVESLGGATGKTMKVVVQKKVNVDLRIDVAADHRVGRVAVER